MAAAAWGIAAAVVTGLVFLASSVTKLASPVAWRAQAGELGVPAAVAAAVPYAEAILAAWLLVQWHRAVAGWVAVGVLLVFTALLAVRLAQGRRPPCACFGSWSAKPIGLRHLLRNAAFIAVAVAAAVL